MKPEPAIVVHFEDMKLLAQVSDSFFELTNRACGIPPALHPDRHHSLWRVEGRRTTSQPRERCKVEGTRRLYMLMA